MMLAMSSEQISGTASVQMTLPLQNTAGKDMSNVIVELMLFADAALVSLTSHSSLLPASLQAEELAYCFSDTPSTNLAWAYR